MTLTEHIQTQIVSHNTHRQCVYQVGGTKTQLDTVHDLILASVKMLL